ncbi:MAG: diheme cytochrome c-553 [Chitinophagaceae bacterium]|nr:MAG: diheme cytochrome c-553 [Chitinophagaceae bacterium]
MKKFSFVSCLILVATVIFSCQETSKTAPESVATISKDSLIRRGEYLVNVIGCGDCHSPKRMGPKGPEADPALLLSGHPAGMAIASIDTAASRQWLLFNSSLTASVGPWGISYAANLTSDDTGIGTWTEEQFFRSIREGKAKGLANGRMLLPPMPWPNFAQLTDHDLKSIFFYLKSTKAVKNLVPAAVAPPDMAKK